MKIIQRFIAVLFAGLILINSNGLLVNTHSCIAKICAENHCGDLLSILDKDNCCSAEKESTKEKQTCCTSETKYIKAAQSDILEQSKKTLFDEFSDVFVAEEIKYLRSPELPVQELSISLKHLHYSPSVSAKNQMRFLQIWRC